MMILIILLCIIAIAFICIAILFGQKSQQVHVDSIDVSKGKMIKDDIVDTTEKSDIGIKDEIDIAIEALDAEKTASFLSMIKYQILTSYKYCQTHISKLNDLKKKIRELESQSDIDANLIQQKK